MRDVVGSASERLLPDTPTSDTGRTVSDKAVRLYPRSPGLNHQSLLLTRNRPTALHCRAASRASEGTIVAQHACFRNQAFGSWLNSLTVSRIPTHSASIVVVELQSYERDMLASAAPDKGASDCCTTRMLHKSGVWILIDLNDCILDSHALSVNRCC